MTAAHAAPLAPKIIEQLSAVSTATLTTQLLQRGFRNTFIGGLIPLRADLRMVGRAFTLRYVPAREDLGIGYDNETNVQRLAVEATGPGDVLVVDARGETSAASLGHILATRLMLRGAAGCVTDGALRDTPQISELQFPVYAKGAHATTSAVLHHPVDMNVPVGCGGVLVMPGDVVVGDAEGVVVIPHSVAPEVAHGAHEQELLEGFLLRKIERGASIRGVYPPNEQTLKEFRNNGTARGMADGGVAP